MGVCSSQVFVEEEGGRSYTPSKMVMGPGKGNMGCKATKESLDPANFAAKNGKKILVIMTDKDQLIMANSKVFKTGHNVTETLVTMGVLANAGYEFEIATATGKAPKFEEWSWGGCGPYEKELRAFKESIDAGLSSPITTADALTKALQGDYIAMFLPGGHGTMIEMHNPPDDGATGKILTHFHETETTTIVICHGPNSFRAAPKDTYKGYEIVGFPDKSDKSSPGIGYMPGQMTEFMTVELEKHHEGFKNFAKKPDPSTRVYKEVVSGCCPAAAYNLGKLAVKVLAEKAS